MTKFFIRWRVDHSMLPKPATPEEIGNLYSTMLKMVKDDLHYGSIREWGQFGNGRDGYAISTVKDIIDLAAVMSKYRPYVTWKIRPVLDVDESMAVIQDAQATAALE